ncbi:MAG: metal ABC transporter substrate-binding protein [Candidatus Methanomethylophilaceae archaeon]
MNKKVLAIVAAVVLVTCAAVVVLADNWNSNDNNKEKIYVTMSWQQEMVQEICGDDYEVVSFISAGSSPHGTNVTPSSIIGAADASVYFYIGSGVEWESNDTLNTISENCPDLNIINMCEESNITLLEGTEAGEEWDPHVWTSPSNLSAFAKVVRDTLVEYYPEDAEIFEAGYEDYTDKTDEIQNLADEDLSDLGVTEIIIWHPAWAYLLSPYGIEQNELMEAMETSLTTEAIEIINGGVKDGKITIYVASVNDLSVSETDLENTLNIQITIVEINPLSLNWLDYLEYAINAFSDSVEG